MFIHHIALNSNHPADFSMVRSHGMVDYLLLHIKSTCTFIIKDQLYTIFPPAVILIAPYVPHKYFAVDNNYCDDYLHFAIHSEDHIIDKLTFPLNVPITLSQDSAINSIIECINREKDTPTQYTDSITTLLLQLLFVKITEQWDILQKKQYENPHYNDLLAIRNLIHSTPNRCFTIDELAQMAHLSSSYFQVMYKKTFGITCITDVIDTKITQAKQLLISTNLSIKELAVELGYNEVYHFIRQFKKHTGLTPLTFRKRCT